MAIHKYKTGDTMSSEDQAIIKSWIPQLLRFDVENEREECALIAETIYGIDSCTECNTQELIAIAIRERSNETPEPK